MWNRRDFGLMAAAALATFGLAVGTFWPRLANAVDDKPAPTTEVKVPTLALGKVQVSAALDQKTPHAVVLTVKNTGDESASTAFKALAQVTPPISPFSRGIRLSLPAWNNDYALDLKPGEVKTISVTLPDKAFDVPATPAQDEKTPAALRTVAGRSELVLSTTNAQNTNDQKPTAIIALVLAGSPATPAAATIATPANPVVVMLNGNALQVVPAPSQPTGNVVTAAPQAKP